MAGAHGVAEQFFKPVGVGLFQFLDIGILLSGGHALELAVAGTYLANDADTRVPRAIGIALGRELVPDALLVGQFLLAVHEVGIARRRGLYGHIAAIVDMDSTGLTFLGRDDDDTRLCLRTIDGSGGGILQYGDALDVLRCNAGHAVGVEGGKVARPDIHVTHRRDVLLQRHTVDHPQRLVVASDGGSTTDTDLRRFTGTAADGLHVDARQLSLHQHVDIGQGLILQFLFRENAHRARRLTDVGLRVARDHHLINRGALALQSNVSAHGASHLQRLGLHTDITDGQRGALGSP